MDIGFIGLGDMGQRMAGHLLENNNLIINNRTKSKSEELIANGAKWCASPRELSSSVEIVILMVTDDIACEEIILGEDGILNSEGKRLTIINMSTITPQTSQNLNKKITAKSWNYIEAPVSGTLPHATNQQLIILTAGVKEIFEKVKPVLEKFGRRIEYFGKIGNALRVKLIINSILAVQAAILAETLVLAEQTHLDPEKLLDIINDSALGNVISKVKGSNMLTKEHQPLFRYKHLIKDLQYMLQSFKGEEISLPIIAKVSEIYVKGEYLHPDLDFSAISEVYRQKLF